MVSNAPNSVSIPKKIMAVKKKKTDKFGKGRIASALGKMLKLTEGPTKSMLVMGTWSTLEKWPMYIKMMRAQSMPHRARLAGMI